MAPGRVDKVDVWILLTGRVELSGDRGSLSSTCAHELPNYLLQLWVEGGHTPAASPGEGHLEPTPQERLREPCSAPRTLVPRAEPGRGKVAHVERCRRHEWDQHAGKQRQCEPALDSRARPLAARTWEAAPLDLHPASARPGRVTGPPDLWK